MSLCRFALRVCAVEALKGGTIAGENVRNSRIGAIDIAADGTLRIDENRVFLDIFTDDSVETGADTRDLRRNGELAINFESGITSAMTETNENGESSIVGVGIPATDDAFEATLDVLDTQIQRRLSDPTSEWAECWRKLIDGVARVERRRIASQDDGVRRAARQLRLIVKARPDPVFAEELAETSAFVRFRRLVDAQLPDLSPVVALMMGEAAEQVPADLMRAAFGQTEAEARALGYARRFAAPIAAYTVRDDRDGSVT
ncbi:hypothetical protein E3C22_18180 [Jiella endophytica]|uniref:Uncharacterized protein n=1 Tax=Jiella endophytica TaxID=2558362 RepID=A0A4Y8RES1_9HYPH|nr:hypothetical protein [Jiella endophytica]TFF20816.1 hypothetical protein E3C22_18180 [Jiella endophytica]